MLCQECEKKSICQTLCPEAELYVSQDEVPWGETPSVYFDQDRTELRVYDPIRGTDKAFLTPMERKILDALASGLTRKEVAEKLNISMSTLRTQIQTLRKKASKP